MKTKVKTKSESGITLVALIITIIILIILAAVTISTLTHEKLAETAIKAAEDYKREQTNEMDKLTELDEKVKETVKNIEEGISKPEGPAEPEQPKPKAPITSDDIGKTVVGYNPSGTSYSTWQDGFDQSGMGATSEAAAQNHTRDTGLGWKVWKVTENEVQIISDKGTMGKIELRDIAGVNNGVRLLDEICSNVYSNSILKIKGATGRNMKLSDIIGKDGNDKRIITVDNENTSYKESQEYSAGIFPQIWIDNERINDTISASEQGGNSYIANQGIEATSSNKYQLKENRWFNTNINSGSFISTAYYNMVIGEALDNGEYWLSTRSMHHGGAEYQDCTFALEGVLNNSIGCLNYLYYSKGGFIGMYKPALRPIVTIPLTSITLTEKTDTSITISY